jgi:hypothetical protein
LESRPLYDKFNFERRKINIDETLETLNHQIISNGKRIKILFCEEKYQSILLDLLNWMKRKVDSCEPLAMSYQHEEIGLGLGLGLGLSLGIRFQLSA